MPRGEGVWGSGNDRQFFNWFSARLKESIEYAMPALREYWLQVAASKLTNPAWLHQYEQDTELRLHEEGGKTKIEFVFNSAMAAAFEYGWAPPRSPNFLDGLKTYDGAPHDMRDYLLADGQDHRAVVLTASLSKETHRYNPSTALDYVIAKMQQAVTPTPLKKSKQKYWQGWKADQGRGQELKDATAAAHDRVRQMITALAGRRGRTIKMHEETHGSLVRPARHDVGLTTQAGKGEKRTPYVEHRTSMMQRAVNRGGRMEVIRTISRGSHEGWFSRGIAPADALEDTMDYAMQIVADALARGKG